MKPISYEILGGRGDAGYLLPKGTERFLQIGEGNFLRAFVDHFIDVANERTGWGAKVAVAQPIQQGLTDRLNAQQGLYTLYLRGLANGEKREEKRVISCISRAFNPYDDYRQFLECAANPALRYIVSNTTEAGIVFDSSCRPDDAPPAAFPAKLTQLLYERHRLFAGGGDGGLVVLSCELIDNNGAALARCVEQYIDLWRMGEDFARWVKQNVLFCSTLVDRIVTGYPREEADALNRANGYVDELMVTGELFGLWVIEGPEWLAEELPFARAGLPVKVVRDHTPYKQRKVRILNGAHTAMVTAAYLAGKDIVRDCMEDRVIRAFLDHALQKEIIPTLALPPRELAEFADAVLDRFQNPYIDHSLLAITLNSTSKWRARVLPSIRAYSNQAGKPPACLTFGFAAQLAFYRGIRLEQGQMIGKRGAVEYAVSDDPAVLEFFFAHRDDKNSDYVQAVCENEQIWGEDLTALPGFVPALTAYLNQIDAVGMYAAMEECMQ